MTRTHVPITPASIIALAALIAGQVAALAPAWAPATAHILQIVTAAVPVAWLLGNAILGHGEATKQAAVVTATAIVSQQPAVLHVVPAPIAQDAPADPRAAWEEFVRLAQTGAALAPAAA